MCAQASTGSLVQLERLAPELQQRAAHVRVLHAQRRVRVPGERRAARAAARLVLGHVGAVGRVVGLLGLPGDDPVLDVDLPRARAGAVDAVRRAHDLVVLPAPPVGGLPRAVARRQRAPAVARDAALDEIARPTRAAWSGCARPRRGTLAVACVRSVSARRGDARRRRAAAARPPCSRRSRSSPASRRRPGRRCAGRRGGSRSAPRRPSRRCTSRRVAAGSSASGLRRPRRRLEQLGRHVVAAAQQLGQLARGARVADEHAADRAGRRRARAGGRCRGACR